MYHQYAQTDPEGVRRLEQSYEWVGLKFFPACLISYNDEIARTFGFCDPYSSKSIVFTIQ